MSPAADVCGCHGRSDASGARSIDDVAQPASATAVAKAAAAIGRPAVQVGAWGQTPSVWLDGRHRRCARAARRSGSAARRVRGRWGLRAEAWPAAWRVLDRARRRRRAVRSRGRAARRSPRRRACVRRAGTAALRAHRNPRARGVAWRATTRPAVPTTVRSGPARSSCVIAPWRANASAAKRAPFGRLRDLHEAPPLVDQRGAGVDLLADADGPDAREHEIHDDVAEQDADRAIARDRQVEAGPAPWITHRKNANAIWKPAYAMRGEPNATHAASHPPANTSAIRCPTDDSDGTTKTSAAVPAARRRCSRRSAA